MSRISRSTTALSSEASDRFSTETLEINPRSSFHALVLMRPAAHASACVARSTSIARLADSGSRDIYMTISSALISDCAAGLLVSRSADDRGSVIHPNLPTIMLKRITSRLRADMMYLMPITAWVLPCLTARPLRCGVLLAPKAGPGDRPGKYECGRSLHTRGICDHHIVVRCYRLLLQGAVHNDDRGSAIKPLRDRHPASRVLGLIRIDDCNPLRIESGFGETHHEPAMDRDVVAEDQMPTVLERHDLLDDPVNFGTVRILHSPRAAPGQPSEALSPVFARAAASCSTASRPSGAVSSCHSSICS